MTRFRVVGYGLSAPQTLRLALEIRKENSAWWVSLLRVLKMDRGNRQPGKTLWIGLWESGVEGGAGWAVWKQEVKRKQVLSVTKWKIAQVQIIYKIQCFGLHVICVELPSWPVWWGINDRVWYSRLLEPWWIHFRFTFRVVFYLFIFLLVPSSPFLVSTHINGAFVNGGVFTQKPWLWSVLASSERTQVSVKSIGGKGRKRERGCMCFSFHLIHGRKGVKRTGKAMERVRDGKNKQQLRKDERERESKRGRENWKSQAECCRLSRQ